MTISNKMSKEDKEKVIAEALNNPEPTVEQEDTDEDTLEENNQSKPTENKVKETKNDENLDEDVDEPKENSDKKPGVEADKKPTPQEHERYKASTKESQVLFLKKTKYEEAVREAKSYSATEDELRVAYPEWDEMTATEQRLAKDNLENKKKFERVAQATEEGDKIQEWADKVDSFLLTDSSKSGIAGKEDEFRAFAMKPTRRGLDLNDLAKIFLWDENGKAENRHKGSLLESGSGGGVTTPKDDGISETQAAVLRTSNHKLYQKLIREKKIKIKID